MSVGLQGASAVGQMNAATRETRPPMSRSQPRMNHLRLLLPFLTLASSLSVLEGKDTFEFDGLRVRQVGDLGPPSMRVDLVIVGEGYTEDDFRPGGEWTIDAARLIKNFFEKMPFKELRTLFNVHLVEVSSLDRGADETPEADRKRTAFDACYGNNGVARLLVCRDGDAVLRAARNAPDADLVVVLVNDSRDGGSGTDVDGVPVSVCSNHPAAYLTAIHELGHSFAGLGDEYVDEAIADRYPLPESGDFPEPNLTLAEFVDTTSRQRLIKTLKWGHYLEEPGATRKYSKGYYEGGYYRARGVYRPALSCIMGTQEGGGRFCFVCKDAMTRAIHRAAGRGPAGGVVPLPISRMNGPLRGPYYFYDAGLFGRVVAQLDKLDKRKGLAPDVLQNVRKLRAGIQKSYERSLERLEKLVERGEALAAMEHMALMEVSFRGTAFHDDVKSRARTITRDRAFKAELKARREYKKILSLVHARAPRELLEKKIAAFSERHKPTKTAKEARHLLTER